jgi:hypothetical protein
MSDTTTPAAEPTVQLHPKFKVGETVVHKGEKTEHRVIAIKPDGLRLEGLAGLVNPAILGKK